jgi:hypothetical protein
MRTLKRLRFFSVAGTRYRICSPRTRLYHIAEPPLSRLKWTKDDAGIMLTCCDTFACASEIVAWLLLLLLLLFPPLPEAESASEACFSIFSFPPLVARSFASRPCTKSKSRTHDGTRARAARGDLAYSKKGTMMVCCRS